jgi:hypothetical protein
MQRGGLVSTPSPQEEGIGSEGESQRHDMEEVSKTPEKRPKVKPAVEPRRSKGTTVGKGVPEGPPRPCPNCGSTKLRSLVKDDEVAAFYEACRARAPIFTLAHPRECKSCGHRWEVTPSKFMLLLALFVLGVGFVIGVVGAIALAGITIGAWVNPEGDRPAGSEVIKGLGFAVFSASLAAGCWFALRYYWARLRRSSARSS